MTARLCEALGPSGCVTRLLEAVEVEPDNAHSKTRSYGRKHVWSIRTRLLLEGRTRNLAMFNLAIDIKRRKRDVVALKVEDVAPNGYTIDRCLYLTEWSSLGGFRAITLRARACVSPLAPRGSRATPPRCSQTLRETIARRH